MTLQESYESLLRPYKDRNEFDLNYPISYKPYVGIIDNNTNQSISLDLPFVSQASSTGPVRAARKIIKPLVTKPQTMYQRNVYSDLEFKEYLDWANLKQLVSSLLHSFATDYFKLLLNQPFEIATLLLQIGSFHDHVSINSRAIADDSDSDSDNDYFTREDDSPHKLRESHIERAPRLSHSKNIPRRPVGDLIEPESLNMLDIVSSLISKEGPRGIFKAVNTSFLINSLQYTLRSWVSGLISGILGIPDPLYVEMIHSPNANLSLVVSLGSDIITGLLLAQLTLIRMKFIVTNSTKGTRSFRQIIWTLPRFFLISPPKELIIPNLITNTVKALTVHYPTYLLTVVWQMNRYNSIPLYNSLVFVLKAVGVFLKLPFETLYNRAQVNYLLTSDSLPATMKLSPEEMCVKFGGYHGYLSTLYYIFTGSKPVDYGSSSFKESVVVEIEDANETNKGYEALVRGWKIQLVRLSSRFILNLLEQESSSSERL
ncbi:hypothetical protein OGAPHI_001000 [Ogataea philodendri]|uniref:Mitochondrial fusion and transport protein UGO1 n=1 Tax=Ogataea philodendri TaxID=1378263 RepID=A0A9P8PF44_9ASCO|nr:uncharacterized protein OGAPHI_001000 [Ogataea philodendri]KAH3670485.1 hypothetical protein OGAPHI_001000 [Ogataea philodendri]